MKETAEILIVGGGVIGLSIAYFLAKEGVKATVVDAGEMGKEASWAGAGMLPSANPKRAKTPLGQLRGLANAAYPLLSAELKGATGLDNGYRVCGALEVKLQVLRPEGANAKVGCVEVLRNAPTPRDGEVVQAIARAGAFRSTSTHPTDSAIPPDHDGSPPRFLNLSELLEQEPALSAHLAGALFFPEAAQVRNPRHLKVLIAACTQRGVRLIPHCPVQEMRNDGERITEVVCSGRSFLPGQVVAAAGAWTSQVWSPESLVLSPEKKIASTLRTQDSALRTSLLRPIRGQMLLLNTGRPILKSMLLAGHQYVVPRDDGRVLVGSTEEDVGFMKGNTEEAIAGLRAFAENLVPAFREAKEEARWSGLRPMSLDKRPILGRAPGFTNLFVASGHYRSGLQLSPITGMILAKLLTGQQPGVDLTPFSLERFGNPATTQPKEAMRNGEPRTENRE